MFSQIQAQANKRNEMISSRRNSATESLNLSPKPVDKKKKKKKSKAKDPFTTTPVQIISVYTAEMELTGKVKNDPEPRKHTVQAGVFFF